MTHIHDSYMTHILPEAVKHFISLPCSLYSMTHLSMTHPYDDSISMTHNRTTPSTTYMYYTRTILETLEMTHY